MQRLLSALYGMFAVAITLTFGLNISFNWGQPPLADYVFFFADRAHRHFYLVNYVYQLYLFVIIAIGGVAVEGAFILLTLFIEARFVFVRRLVAMLDERRYDDAGYDVNRLGANDGMGAPMASLSAAAATTSARLRLINTMIDVHSDVLRYVERNFVSLHVSVCLCCDVRSLAYLSDREQKIITHMSGRRRNVVVAVDSVSMSRRGYQT